MGILTDFASSNNGSLLSVESLFTGRRFKKLDKSIGLLDGYLSQLSKFVEYVE